MIASEHLAGATADAVTVYAGAAHAPRLAGVATRRRRTTHPAAAIVGPHVVGAMMRRALIHAAVDRAVAVIVAVDRRAAGAVERDGVTAPGAPAGIVVEPLAGRVADLTRRRRDAAVGRITHPVHRTQAVGRVVKARSLSRVASIDRARDPVIAIRDPAKDDASPLTTCARRRTKIAAEAISRGATTPRRNIHDGDGFAWVGVEARSRFDRVQAPCVTP